mmetsp:Transcript_8321/g.21101  ORF Transcript_8321/g.21101 Transcript_8321/m.21101 type:complete len:287 (-) Transcript_8321:205-1065(-)
MFINLGAEPCRDELATRAHQTLGIAFVHAVELLLHSFELDFGFHLLLLLQKLRELDVRRVLSIGGLGVGLAIGNVLEGIHILEGLADLRAPAFLWRLHLAEGILDNVLSLLDVRRARLRILFLLDALQDVVDNVLHAFVVVRGLRPGASLLGGPLELLQGVVAGLRGGGLPRGFLRWRRRLLWRVLFRLLGLLACLDLVQELVEKRVGLCVRSSGIFLQRSHGLFRRFHGFVLRLPLHACFLWWRREVGTARLQDPQRILKRLRLTVIDLVVVGRERNRHAGVRAP